MTFCHILLGFSLPGCFFFFWAIPLESCVQEWWGVRGSGRALAFSSESRLLWGELIQSCFRLLGKTRHQCEGTSRSPSVQERLFLGTWDFRLASLRCQCSELFWCLPTWSPMPEFYSGEHQIKVSKVNICSLSHSNIKRSPVTGMEYIILGIIIPGKMHRNITHSWLARGSSSFWKIG